MIYFCWLFSSSFPQLFRAVFFFLYVANVLSYDVFNLDLLCNIKKNCVILKEKNWLCLTKINLFWNNYKYRTTFKIVQIKILICLTFWQFSCMPKDSLDGVWIKKQNLQKLLQYPISQIIIHPVKKVILPGWLVLLKISVFLRANADRRAVSFTLAE